MIQDKETFFLKPVVFYKPKDGHVKYNNSEYRFVIGVYIVSINLEKLQYKTIVDLHDVNIDGMNIRSDYFHDNIEDVYKNIDSIIGKFGDINIEVLSFLCSEYR